MDEEAQTSLVVGRTSWPAGLRSIEEQRKKEEEEREQEAWQQLQEEQWLQRKQGEEGPPTANPQLEGLPEQDRQQEPQQLQEQQQQGASRWQNCSTHPIESQKRRKSLATRRRICPFSATRPRRGSVQGRLQRSRQSRGGRTAWWHLPA